MNRLFLAITILFLTISCNIDNVLTGDLAPEITFENNNGVFRVKQGRTITISPKYNNVENAQYCWSLGSEVLSTEPELVYSNDIVGQYYITLTVTTPSAQEQRDLRIDVVELEIPWVSLPNAEEGFIISTDSELRLNPSVKDCSIETAFCWYIDDTPVSQEQNYIFSSEVTGEFAAKFVARNDDGADSLTFAIAVCLREDLPMGWSFDQTEYNYSSGRSIKISPAEIINGEDAIFCWFVDGELVQEDTIPYYLCSISEEGTYTITATASRQMGTSEAELSQTLTVNVLPQEGQFYRPKSATSQARFDKIYEYTPAPGQFINDILSSGFSGVESTMEEAVEYAQQRLGEDIWISLGGFGGYIVAGFDHSVDCTGGYDLAISGNSFDGASEPGIVWVMQDENGDGQPNDTWYELRGSETGTGETIYDYAVTYYRPTSSGMDVQWTDNQGCSGEIEYLKQYHNQDFYFPSWIKEDKYTLRGTRLQAKNYDSSGNGAIWVLPPYDWGYVDNNSSIDLLGGENSAEGNPSMNLFKISNAIDYAGNPLNLAYIDFVKIQCGVNAKSGWVGETSTEVSGIYDYNSMQ